MLDSSAMRRASLRPGSPGFDSSVPPELFARFQALIYRESGIWLAPHKQALLIGRLSRRLRILGITSFFKYYQLVAQFDQMYERALMIDCITTNETHFFREPRHFDYLANTIFPSWITTKPDRYIRVWSAGCSTGEEPYSLAMLLLNHFPQASGWTVEVIGTDISTSVLEKARAAIYPLERAKQIPGDLLRQFMLRGIGTMETSMTVGPELREVVRFARLNLHGDAYPLSGTFDLIFCRNVMIYFDDKSKQKVIAGILRHLSPSGLLLVGHSENLTGIASGLTTVAPTIYALRSREGGDTSALNETDKPNGSLRDCR